MIAPNSNLAKLDLKEELNVRERKLLKVVIKCGGNETEASEVIGCSPQNISKRMRLLEKKVGFARLMDYHGLADNNLAIVLNDGLKATRPIITDGEVASTVEDHPTRHKFLTTALKIKKHIDSDDKSGINQTFNINFGHRQAVKTVDV